MGRLRIYVLGPVRVVREGDIEGTDEPIEIPGREPLSLLALLAYARGEVPRDRIIESILGEAAVALDASRQNTYDWTNALRNALGDQGRDIIVTARGRGLSLGRGPDLWIDYDAFLSLRKAGKHRDALELIKGEFAENVVFGGQLAIQDDVREQARHSATRVGAVLPAGRLRPLSLDGSADEGSNKPSDDDHADTYASRTGEAAIGEAKDELSRLARGWRDIWESSTSDAALANSLVTRMRRLLNNVELARAQDIGVLRDRLALGDAIAVLHPQSPQISNSTNVGAPRSVGPLRVIPHGPFVMGSDTATERDAFFNEAPRVERVLPYDVAMGRYPVTVAQFTAFVHDSGYDEADWWKSWRPGAQRQEALASYLDQCVPNHPVTNINRYEAEAYCRWIQACVAHEPASGLARLDGSETSVRLPREPEWEKAARGSTGGRYPWTGTASTAFRVERRLAYRGTTPVGLFPDEESPYGVEELIGNIWEWCDGAYSPNNALGGDVTIEDSDKSLAPVRGGGRGSDRRMLRAACRFGVAPEECAPDRGFRIVVAPPD